MVNPYFSIISPAYNRAKFLNETIKSVLNQTYTNWEFIIIDDASTDNSYEIIKSFKDDRIIYIRNEVNLERGASRNKGLKAAKGRYICFLDSDDVFLENHLEVLFKNISSKNEPVALFYTTSFQRINDGTIHKREFFPFDEKNKFAYILRYTFNHNCVCAHRDIFNDYIYDPIIPGLEDIDLWLHIALKYPIIQIHEYTNLLNFHEGSYTVGDYERFAKELKNFKYIFNKPEFKTVLPRSGKNRLLSMCHYRLAIRYENEKRFYKMYSSIIKAFILYPPGYNRNTNKPMLVMFLYHIPIAGYLLKKIINLKK